MTDLLPKSPEVRQQAERRSGDRLSECRWTQSLADGCALVRETKLAQRVTRSRLGRPRAAWPSGAVSSRRADSSAEPPRGVFLYERFGGEAVIVSTVVNSTLGALTSIRTAGRCALGLAVALLVMPLAGGQQ